MNYLEMKKLLQETGEGLGAVVRSTANESTMSDLADWRSDLDTDVFTVAVVGEFNRGKSTLLNALFGLNVLPVGVTPTTAVVTILHFSEVKQIRVNHVGGRVETLAYSESALSNLVASSPSSVAAIDYVEVGIPHTLLSSGVVYVDTPGVSDLSRERTEVTYRFVPRADAVLFVIDATAPVKRSEIDFLKTAILDKGVDRLVFVSNFSDLLDEDERAEAKDKTQNKIAVAIGAANTEVFLVSAEQGCSAQTRAISGIDALLAELQKISSTGPRSQEKVARMRDRLASIFQSAKRDVERLQATRQLDADEFMRQSAAVEKQWRNREAKIERIKEWVDDREAEIFAMAQKSLDKFIRDLRDDLQDIVASCSNPDFKTFVEVQIPLQVKRRCKAWVEGHGDGLRSLLLRLSSELTEALSREFKTNLPLLEPSSASIGTSPETGLSPRTFQTGSVEENKGRMHAGLIIGGVSTLLFFAGLPFAGPLISLAAYPFISNRLEKGNMEKAKREFMPELDKAINSAAKAMRANLLDYLDTEIRGLQSAAEVKYRQLLDAARSGFTKEMSNRSQATSIVRCTVRVFEEEMAQLNSLETRLFSVFPKESKGEST